MENRERFEILTLRDNIDMRDYVKLAMYDETAWHLKTQSNHGHALEGHGKFKKTQERFPEASLEDVILALDENPINIKAQRQTYIDEVFHFIYRLAAGEKVEKYMNIDNKPLFRINMFQHRNIKNPASVLIGFYLGSRMDNYSTWRKKTEEKYGITIGGGECIGINRTKAKANGIDLNSFKTKEHCPEEVDYLIKQGILCVDVPSTSEITHGYVRYKIGPGTSDDLAIILAGKLYDKDAALGVFLADAIDTWDKYTPLIHANGQDEKLGTLIEDNANNIDLEGFQLPTEEEVLKFIYLITENNYSNMISESQRYFLQIDKKTQICSIQSHLKFLSFKEEDRKREIESLEKEKEEAKEKFKGHKKTKRRACKKIQKSINKINSTLGLKEMHIGHINSGLTNIQLYKKFERKYKEIYGYW